MGLTTLEGRRLLIVEDEYLVASELMSALEEAGAKVFGPVSDVERAVEIVEGSDFKLDCVILDINLRGEKVYPAAALLADQGIPFVFVTGYKRSSLPEAFADAPCLTKPVDEQDLIRRLVSLWKQDSLGLGGSHQARHSHE
jgi:CheY-like chemotaxis protein